MKIRYAQMAKQLDATSKTCSTEVGTSANLVLGTIDDYILQEEIVPLPAKKINENNDIKNKRLFITKNRKVKLLLFFEKIGDKNTPRDEKLNNLIKVLEKKGFKIKNK